MPASNQGVGMNTGFPDVCNTPVGPATAPIPYPNVGANAMSMPFCPTILVSFAPGHNQLAKPAMTNGDNAGVAHPLFMQPGGNNMGSIKIFLMGVPAEHLTNPCQGNNYNCSLDAKLVPSVTNVLMTCCPPSGAEGLAAAVREVVEDDPGATLGLTAVPDAGGGLRVVHVRRDGTADRLGVRAGDVLEAVGGRDLAAAEALPDVAPGAPVALTVRRAGAGRLELRGRGAEAAPAVSGRLRPDGVGHLVVRRFPVGLAARARAVLDGLAEGGARGIVLDLRGNPGGALEAAVDLAGSFCPAGTPVARVEDAGADAVAAVPPGASPVDLPLAVLVDGQTASAGEVLAAALQDAGRAVVVGRATFGKGVALEALRDAPSGPAPGDRIDLRRPEGGRLAWGVEPDRPGGLDDAVAALEASRGRA